MKEYRIRALIQNGKVIYCAEIKRKVLFFFRWDEIKDIRGDLVLCSSKEEITAIAKKILEVEGKIVEQDYNWLIAKLLEDGMIPVLLMFVVVCVVFAFFILELIKGG